MDYHSVQNYLTKKFIDEGKHFCTKKAIFSCFDHLVAHSEGVRIGLSHCIQGADCATDSISVVYIIDRFTAMKGKPESKPQNIWDVTAGIEFVVQTLEEK